MATATQRRGLVKTIKRPLYALRISLSRGLCSSALEREEHLAAMRQVLNNPELERLHDWIHTNLIILDSKAQSLLALYSIALAVLTVFYSALSSSAPKFVILATFLAFVVIAWSIVPLARISFVYWCTTDEFRNPDKMLLDLLCLRDARSRIIRISTIRGAISLGIFILLLLWDTLRRV